MRKANNLTTILGTLTSWNPLGTLGPVMGLIYLYAKTRSEEKFPRSRNNSEFLDK
jgi:hypothetical protein